MTRSEFRRYRLGASSEEHYIFVTVLKWPVHCAMFKRLLAYMRKYNIKILLLSFGVNLLLGKQHFSVSGTSGIGRHVPQQASVLENRSEFYFILGEKSAGWAEPQHDDIHWSAGGNECNMHLLAEKAWVAAKNNISEMKWICYGCQCCL